MNSNRRDAADKANGTLPATAWEAARYYREHGRYCVPVPLRGKRCVVEGWPSLRLDVNDLDAHFPEGTSQNVGLLLGEPSGGLVDIDLDVPEAAAVAPLLLPQTGWVSGHKSKPRSHYWYAVSDPPARASEEFHDIDGAMLMEVRSTGGQTVVPPSVHESGERVVWHVFTQPAPAERGPLLAAARSVAAAALLVRHWPGKGSLHKARLALAGGLARLGWPEDRITSFVQAVTAAAGNRDLRDAAKVGDDSLGRVEGGGKATGWPTLEQLIGRDGPEVVARVRRWLGVQITRSDLPLPVEPPWPDPLAPEAFHGLAGELARVLEPASEADPAAHLVQTLVAFGNVVGRGPHFTVEADRHFTNEFAVLVGRTSKGRKGLSWGRIYRLLQDAEEEWARERVQTGLSSGEGLIWAVRDPIQKMERVKDRGEPVRYLAVEADPGVADKRLLVVEPEFASVLKQTERQGNTLSAVLRQAWESGDLRTMTKNSPARATDSLVSLIGHCTAEELRRYLSTTEIANGFGNRILWVCVQRSKVLPEGGHPDPRALADLQARMAEALAFARTVGQMSRDAEARGLWHEIYGELSEGRPGLAGALLGRAEAHVMRLAMLYALMDQSRVMGARHLLAALALWEYVEQSVRHVFGDSLGDPVADDLLRLIRAHRGDGMTRTEMSAAFGKHLSSDRIGRALALLLSAKRVRTERHDTGGRPEERWYAVGPAGA